MVILDYKDRRPLYEQIVEKLSELILKGVLAPDEKLPSVRNLAMELSINPNTIQRAYTELEHRGFIYSVKGRGNFVSDDGNLLKERKKEILINLKMQMIEAKSHQISKDVLQRMLEDVYSEQGGKDCD